MGADDDTVAGGETVGDVAPVVAADVAPVDEPGNPDCALEGLVVEHAATASKATKQMEIRRMSRPIASK